MGAHGAAATSVLIADDDAAFRGLVAGLLREAGYRVRTAETAEEAIELALAERPALALLDINLPRIGGYEVCRQLRDMFGQDVAIAFLTGTRTESFDRSAGLLVGADDYIVKPFEPGELLARVRALLRRAPAHPELEPRPSLPDRVGLTARELEVLRLLAHGVGQAEIADRLGIRAKTVGRHVEHILAKLNVHSRSQAVALAYRDRIVAPAPSLPADES